MLSYQKLRKLPPGEDEDGDVRKRGRWRWRWRRRRPIRLRLARLIRRAVRRRTEAVGSAVRSSVEKVVRRLKEGRPFLGDLFAGNYLFMQVNPVAAMPHLDKYLLQASKLRQRHGGTPRAAYLELFGDLL